MFPKKEKIKFIYPIIMGFTKLIIRNSVRNRIMKFTMISIFGTGLGCAAQI